MCHPVSLDVRVFPFSISCLWLLMLSAPWWDRSCDLGLIVGTFIHGLGNYEAMRGDEELPFINRINYYVKCNRAAAESYRRFENAAVAAKG